MLGAGDGAGRSAGAVVHGHLQVQGHTEAAVGQLLDAHDFRDIFAVHRVMGGGEGKSDKDAHTLIVAVAASMEVNAFF